MRLSKLSRNLLATLAALLASTISLAATGTGTTPAGAPAGKAKPATPVRPNGQSMKGATAEPAGYSIERPPAWVKPLAPDASINVPNAPVQVLLIDRQTRVERNRSMHFMHFVRQIHDAAGLQQGAQIQIEFDPSYQGLALHQLVIVRGDQRIDKLDRKIVKLLHRETQLERQMVDGRMTASIVLDDLRIGDRVEWSASVVGENPVFGGRFVDVEWLKAELGPVGLLQIRLLAADDRKLQYKVAEPAVEVTSQVHDGWRETLFRRRGAPQFRSDPSLPSSEYLKDQIEISEFADWGEVAAWAEQLFAKAIQPSEAVNSKVAEIEAQASAPADRLRAALDFVQQDVRYFGTEIGADSHQPASADTVLRQRFGDCKDKVALLATLLGRLGFEATPVLVSTAYSDDVATRLPSPLAFNHAIASVMVDGQRVWLDGTRSQQRGAVITRQPVGLGQGLLARAGNTALTPLPSSSDALRSETVDTLSFPKLAEEGTLTSVTTYYGDLAEWLRDSSAALSAEDFEKSVTVETLRAFPSFVPDGAPLLEPVADSNAIKLTMHYRTGASYWRFPEQRQLLGDFALLNLVAPLRLPDQAPRTQPLRVAMPGRYHQTVRFAFGEDITNQPSSSEFNETNAQFELHVHYSGQHNEQLIDGDLHQTAHVIDAAQWEPYRERLTKVWPRLAGAVNVPPLSPPQIEALRSDLTALGKSIQRGEVKVSTRDQFNARARLLVLDKVLAAGRLPPKPRADALIEQGSQLDHLGRQADAQIAFQKAIDLDGSNAEAHAALAVNALMRRQDAEAIDQASQALQLAPSTTGAHYTRAWAHYFAGEPAPARDELTEVLQSRSEAERSYGAIWLYLATRRLGEDGSAAVQPFLPTAGKPEWPYAVLQLMNGKIDFSAALAATRDGDQPNRGRECELYFYAAQKALADGDAAKARGYLQKSVATEVVEFNEYAMARRELDRLGAH